MAKQIIILETNPSDGGMNTINAVFWFAIAPNRQVPQPTVTASRWSGASAPEIDAIKTGAVLEEVSALSVPTSYTNAQIKGALVSKYNDRLTYLNAQPFKLQFNGIYYDGSVWSA